jgi:hypothetical protein
VARLIVAAVADHGPAAITSAEKLRDMSKLIGKSFAPLQFQHLIEIAIDDFVLARVCFVLYLMAGRPALEQTMTRGK